MFQVVVVVCGRAGIVVFVIAASLCNIDIIYIDTDISDVEYNGGFTFLGKTAKGLRNPFMPGSSC
jgi:hypothetical protein